MEEKKFKILICDDSLLILRKMRKILTTLGDFEIVEANNGQIAIEQFDKERPDLVFLDYVMPLKNGLEVLKAVKKIDKSVPVVMVSSVGTLDNVNETIKEGAHDFVQKPLNQELIHGIVKKILTARGVE